MTIESLTTPLMLKLKQEKWPTGISRRGYRMGNRLFQEAKKAVQLAHGEGTDKQAAIGRAENALTSAFANSTLAEKQQLHQYQDELDSIKGNQ
jgi:hypothetical protein